MHKVVSFPALARRRTVKCVSAWTIAIAVISVAAFGMVRYERVPANCFDWPILLTLNHHVFQVEFINRSISALSRMPILTGIPLAGLFWYLWFECKSDSAKTGLLLGFGAAIAAVILSRGLQLALPTHLRPLHNPALRFKPPPGIDITTIAAVGLGHLRSISFNPGPCFYPACGGAGRTGANVGISSFVHRII